MTSNDDEVGDELPSRRTTSAMKVADMMPADDGAATMIRDRAGFASNVPAPEVATGGAGRTRIESAVIALTDFDDVSTLGDPYIGPTNPINASDSVMTEIER
jgi:hypothetical protein